MKDNPRNKNDLQACARKIRYKSKRSATNALEAMMVKRPAKDIVTLDVYHCTACGGFHLGNSKKRRNPHGI